MKKQTLEIELADVSRAAFAKPLLGILIAALRMARGRKQSRTAVAERMVAKGYLEYRKPHPESWRDLLARYLRRVLPRWCVIYVGGHHIAVHARSVTTGTDLGPCLARFVEAKPI